jgi:hypothetical protein
LTRPTLESVRRRDFHKSQRKQLVALAILVVAIACNASNDRRNSSLRSKAWHQMLVTVDSSFTLTDDDSVLVARPIPSSDKSEHDILIFKMIRSEALPNFETRKRQCSQDTACQTKTDTSGGTVYECLESRSGALATRNEVASARCRMLKSPIEARYLCNNEVCDAFIDVIAKSFASFPKSAS